MNLNDRNEMLLSYGEKRIEFIAGFHFIEPCISKIQGGQQTLRLDIGEIVSSLSRNTCNDVERKRIREILTAYLQDIDGMDDALAQSFKNYRPTKHRKLKLECLSSLCSYDTENGTTYALLWGTLLSSLTSQIAAHANTCTPQQATYWRLLDDMGSLVLSRRRPKHFASGLQLYSLEIVLLIDRAVSLLSTPLAIVLSLCSTPGTVPDFISVSEQLKHLSIGQLRILGEANPCARRQAIRDDLMTWRYNSSIRRCSGAPASPACKSVNKQELGVQDVISSLAIFDEVCKTEWSASAKNFFHCLHTFA